MRAIVALIVGALCAGMFAGAADAAERYTKQKVVYHINYNGGEDDKAYLAALRNVRNHIEAVGAKNLDIKVVLHGDGVGLLKSAKSNDPIKTAVVGLKSDNVGFQVCNFTLTGRKIDPAKDLYDVFAEDIVPSGVAELAHLQSKGYAYIKP
jgi:uncharacterized protein